MRTRLDKRCINCHFLVARPKGHRTPQPGVISINNPPLASLTLEEREDIRNAQGIRDASFQVAFYFGVWTPVDHRVPETMRKEMLERDRHDFCFFWTTHEGMLFEAAETLQKRDAENAKSSQDRKLTLIGLWIAAVA